MDPIAFNPSTDITFVIKNNSSMNRSIKVFNTKINPGGQLDLMKIPGVTEEDIRSELTKGSLKSLLSGGSLSVISSTVNLATLDSSHYPFLQKINLTPLPILCGKVIFKPGAATTGIQYSSFSQIIPLIAATQGILDIYIDDSLAPASTGANLGMIDCQGRVRILPYQDNTLTIPTLNIDDGTTLQNLNEIFGNVILNFKSKTTSSLAFTTASATNAPIFSIRSRTGSPLWGLILDASATIAPIQLAANSQLNLNLLGGMVDNSNNQSVPIFNLGANSTLNVFCQGGARLRRATMFTGDATSTLNLFFDHTSRFQDAQPTFAGSVNFAHMEVSTFMAITADYTQPNVSSTVTVSVARGAFNTDLTRIFSPGMKIRINGGGLYSVSSTPTSTTMVIQNLGGFDNISGGTVIAHNISDFIRAFPAST